MDGKKEYQPESNPILQVLICTYGREGLMRVEAASHPETEGVEYLVSCQCAPEDAITELPEAFSRKDFKIFFSSTKGLAVNRNIALSRATAPLLLISDDDADYTKAGLRSVIDNFAIHPEADIITFRFASTTIHKPYPDHEFSLSAPPKGYYASSIEIAFRREAVQGKIWFNENFGVGALFPSGEEDVFLKDCLDHGLSGLYIPLTITRHDSPTTSGRNLLLPSRPMTKGAVFLRLHPRQWPLRMLIHALREIPLWRKGHVPSPFAYCLNWIKGVRMARDIKAFPTPDYSSHYTSHD